MTKDDIIRMAREAGLLVIGTADGSEAVYTWPQGITDELERFAALVEAKASEKEREACAQVCDDHATKDGFEGCYADACAESIRARGKEA